MIDPFGREINYLRVSVTDLCNLRCRYCMTEDGVEKKSHMDMLREEEYLMAISAAASLGIKKIRITGGEPLIKKDIVSICDHAHNVAGIDEVCITTNGILLPRFAKDLKTAGVSRINISLDTLDSEKYHYITRTGELKDALEGLETALDTGFKKIKVNAVLIGGFNDDEIPELCKLTLKYPVDMRFIELMPMPGEFNFDDKAYIPGKTVLEKMPELIPEPHDGGVATLFKLPNALGRVGLINPISAHFCGSCNRLRLMSDGTIKPCLHTSTEHSIKGLDYQGIKQAFIDAIMNKPARHPDLSKSTPSQSIRNMNEIGG